MSSTVIVGAGAAGLVAAIFAAERSSVTVIERTSETWCICFAMRGNHSDICTPSALVAMAFPCAVPTAGLALGQGGETVAVVAAPPV